MTTATAQSTKVLFFGTPQFAVPTLEALAEAGHPLLVVTGPDARVGRKQVKTPTAVKQAAERLGLTILQPNKLDETFLTLIKQWKPSVAILAAYGKIIPQRLLDLPVHGFLNIHPSALPRHRGASPIAASILAGESETAVTIMKMDAGLDTGPIIHAEPFPLHGTETTGALTETLSHVAARLVTKVVLPYCNGNLVPQPQDDTLATMTRRINKESSELKWISTAAECERAVRAYSPWPSAWTRIQGKRLKILRAHIHTASANDQPGTLQRYQGAIGITCGDHKVLMIDEAIPEGKKALSVAELYDYLQRATGSILPS